MLPEVTVLHGQDRVDQVVRKLIQSTRGAQLLVGALSLSAPQRGQLDTRQQNAARALNLGDGVSSQLNEGLPFVRGIGVADQSKEVKTLIGNGKKVPGRST